MFLLAWKHPRRLTGGNGQLTAMVTTMMSTDNRATGISAQAIVSSHSYWTACQADVEYLTKD